MSHHFYVSPCPCSLHLCSAVSVPHNALQCPTVSMFDYVYAPLDLYHIVTIPRHRSTRLCPVLSIPSVNILDQSKSYCARVSPCLCPAISLFYLCLENIHPQGQGPFIARAIQQIGINPWLYTVFSSWLAFIVRSISRAQVKEKNTNKKPRVDGWQRD